MFIPVITSVHKLRASLCKQALSIAERHNRLPVHAVVAGVSDATGGTKRHREETEQNRGELTPETIRSMKVSQLRAELAKRDLAVGGVRNGLMIRLEAALSP